MTYTIEFLPKARRQFLGLDPPVRRRIGEAIDALAEDPRPPGVKKLAGGDDRWRIRVGDYRILYQIRDRELVVLVVQVGHRGDVYR